MDAMLDPLAMPATEPLEAVNQAEIDRELRLVDSAIAMVRRGVARRVTLASLPLGREVLRAAGARAGMYGLRVRPVTDAEDGPLALVVEPGEVGGA